MKDLFVLTADLDALAVMRSVLGRPQALGIRPIAFEVDRHPMRDSGVVGSGPELARLDFAARGGASQDVTKEAPKELLDAVFRRRFGRTARPSEFESIAATASLRDWCMSQSFAAVAGLLRGWFPEAKTL